MDSLQLSPCAFTNKHEWSILFFKSFHVDISRRVSRETKRSIKQLYEVVLLVLFDFFALGKLTLEKNQSVVDRTIFKISLCQRSNVSSSTILALEDCLVDNLVTVGPKVIHVEKCITHVVVPYVWKLCLIFTLVSLDQRMVVIAEINRFLEHVKWLEKVKQEFGCLLRDLFFLGLYLDVELANVVSCERGREWLVLGQIFSEVVEHLVNKWVLVEWKHCRWEVIEGLSSAHVVHEVMSNVIVADESGGLRW